MPTSPSHLFKWFVDPDTQGIVGWFGLVLTIVGFAITFFQVWRSKSAADAAAAAARAVQSQLDQFDAITACSTAVQQLQEIERLHRLGTLDILPERYSVVRTALNQLRSINPAPDATHLTNIQNAISQLALLKERAEKLLSNGTANLDVPKANRVTSRIIDDLHELLTALRRNTQ